MCIPAGVFKRSALQLYLGYPQFSGSRGYIERRKSMRSGQPLNERSNSRSGRGASGQTCVDIRGAPDAR
jgi:hypothetical protein